MGRIIASFLFFGFLKITSTNSAAVDLTHKCYSDLECPENFYCYMISNMCAECKENFCTNVNRNNSYLKCPKEYLECGACLPGYEEEILTDGSPRAPCIKSQILPLTMDPENIGPANYTFPSIIASTILFAVLIIVVGFVFYNKRKPQIMRANSCIAETIPLNDLQQFLPIATSEVALIDKPPPYNPTAPLINEIEPKELSKTILTFVEVNMNSSSGGANPSGETENSKEKYQSEKIPAIDNVENQRLKATDNRVQAIKFRDPDCDNESLRCESSEEIHINPPIVIPEHDETGFDPQYHSEETQESSWTPNSSESSGEGASCTIADESPPKKVKLDTATKLDDNKPDLSSRPFQHFSREKKE